jgi:hypothetical protein
MPALVRPDLSVVTATSWAACVRVAAARKRPEGHVTS